MSRDASKEFMRPEIERLIDSYEAARGVDVLAASQPLQIQIIARHWLLMVERKLIDRLRSYREGHYFRGYAYGVNTYEGLTRVRIVRPDSILFGNRKRKTKVDA